MIPDDIKAMSDEELNDEILRLEHIQHQRFEAMVSLVLRLLDRVKVLESKVLSDE